MSECLCGNGPATCCSPAQPLCVCGNDLTVSEAENGWECAACRWEADRDARAER